MTIDPIEGNFVRIRTAGSSDADFTLSVRREKQNTRFMPELNISPESQKKWIAEQISSKDSMFLVIERISGEKIGTFSLYNICGKTAETGRLVLRGNQIETIETMVLFHDYIFNTTELEYIYSMIDIDNLPALGLAKRLGSEDTGHVFDKKRNKEMIKMAGSKEIYMQKRGKLQELIDRFSNRQASGR
ncbi:MAG: GNAT family N-acetyltransferase [Porcipelethomonas sp.]